MLAEVLTYAYDPRFDSFIKMVSLDSLEAWKRLLAKLAQKHLSLRTGSG